MLTGAGTILGTAAYMSPEQARGKPADKRADIWAFGCVLFEMLTGERPFAGETLTETLAAILERNVDWTKLPARTPETVRAVLRRSLEKDPRRRLRDIADACLDPDEAAPAAAPAPGRWRWIAAIVATALVAAAATWFAAPSGPVPAPAAVTRVNVALDLAAPVDGENALALSPDGRRLVHIGLQDGVRRLYVRDLDRFDSVALPGTEGAEEPAFSPDGRWLAFVADRKIKKVSVDGGRPVELCEVATSHGLSWASNDAILFHSGVGGIWRVPAGGGAVEQVTTLDVGDLEHRYPEPLPDGKHMLYSALHDSDASIEVIGHIIVRSLETGEHHELTLGTRAHYLPSGQLVFIRGGDLYAAPFDLDRLELSGPPVLVLQGIRNGGVVEGPQIAYSDAGVVAYVPGDAAGRLRTLVWVNRDGTEAPGGESGVLFSAPRLGPDSEPRPRQPR